MKNGSDARYPRDKLVRRIEEALDATPPQLNPSARPAATLLLVDVSVEEPQVLFTRRADALRRHAGEIAFPGGAREEVDDSFHAAALREAQEEVGLDRRRVRVAGFLSSVSTAFGYEVVPVVGFADGFGSLKPDPVEVRDVFSVPLRFLMDPANHHDHSFRSGGRRINYVAIPWNERYIWGATARMVKDLFRRAFDGFPPADFGLSRSAWAAYSNFGGNTPARTNDGGR